VQTKEEAVRSVPRGGTGGTWQVDLAGQNASLITTDLVAAGSVKGGLYVVKGIARVTTGAGTSSSVTVQIRYTDADGNTALLPNVEGFLETGVAGVVGTPNNSTLGGGIFYFSKVINAKAGVAIQYSTTYASNPASTMVYSLHLICSRF
jgi:hypothetical protein